jgi:CxxC-x17-CxxC domain-containing protein
LAPDSCSDATPYVRSARIPAGLTGGHIGVDCQELTKGRSQVSYQDRTVTCADCGVEFIHSAADQEFYAQKGFASDPKRCPSCRASRRQMRETSGFDVREIGGPRGYERGDSRPQREYFAVICSKCGNAAQVPFKPRQDKPVYCSDCFRDVQAAS